MPEDRDEVAHSTYEFDTFFIFSSLLLPEYPSVSQDAQYASINT